MSDYCLILTVKRDYYRDAVVNMSDARYDMRGAGVPVSAVVTALKQFFSELCEPVIPLELYDDLKDAISTYQTCCS